MRLITRPDIDGVMCAVFITYMERIEQVIYADPKDIEDGSLKVERGDCIANLPYHPNCTLWFDHHPTEEESTQIASVAGKRGVAPSAARLVYEHYNSPRLEAFSEILSEVDRIDSANLILEDVLNPQKWVLLSFTLDPFMGLQAFQGYANSIVADIKSGAPIEQILESSEVKSRIRLYLMDSEDFKHELRQASRLEDNVLITDIRDIEIMPHGNRFLAFAIFPDCDVQIVISLNKRKEKVRIRIGKSILKDTCQIHLGKLMAEYDGGGLSGAGGCLLELEGADAKINEIIARLKTSA